MIELRLEQFESELPGFWVRLDGTIVDGPMGYAEARRLALAIGRERAEPVIEVTAFGERLVLDPAIGRAPSEEMGRDDEEGDGVATLPGATAVSIGQSRNVESRSWPAGAQTL